MPLFCHILGPLATTTTTAIAAAAALLIQLPFKTSLDLNETRDDGFWGWQWHQLDHMQTICTWLQTDNHTNTSSLNFYRQGALPDA